MRSSHVAIQFSRFRFRVISIARPFAPFTPALDEKQVCRQLADFAIAWRESRRINVEARWKRQTAVDRSS
jgi:hypothetical protein